MLPVRVGLVTVLCLGILATPTQRARAAGNVKETGEVELLILAPDGRPAVKTEVRAEPPGQSFFDKLPQQIATTDDSGKVVFAWPAGVLKLRVSVKGVGYGLTGVTQIPAGKRVKAALPPLAAWGTIRGQVPPELLTADTRVRVDTRAGTTARYDRSEQTTVTPEKDGAFQAEVPAGAASVWASNKETRTAQTNGEISVGPGQVVRVGLLEKVPPLPYHFAEQPKAAARGVEHPTVTWVNGTVRDTTGKPVPGADVYAVGTYWAGAQMGEMTCAAKTDSDGHYQIMGEGGHWDFSATLIAHAPGRCPTWSWLPVRPEVMMLGPQEEPPAAKPPAPTVDFVLTDQGGTLEVEVVREGKAFPGATVGVRLAGVDLSELCDRADPAAVQAASPVGKTDAKGVVRFENLVPGMYQIVACELETPEPPELPDPWSHNGPFAEAIGIAVQKGAVTRHRLAIHPRGPGVSVRVLRIDGRPLANKEVLGALYDMSGDAGFNWIKFDAQGIGACELESGLRQLSIKYLDVPYSSPLSSPPYDEAAGIVAASPLLHPKGPVTLASQSVLPAAVTVKLLDGAGNPLRGTVAIGTSYGDLTAIGSTDGAPRTTGRGTVRFEGLCSAEYQVRAYVAGLAPLEFGEGDAPLPDDAVLRVGRAMLVATIKPLPNSDTTVVLKAQPVGYVRGLVKPTEGRRANCYEIHVPQEQLNRGAGLHYQPETGAFVAGPFPPGKVSLGVFEYASESQVAQQEVAIEAGQVTKVEIHPVAPQPAEPAALSEPAEGLWGLGGLLTRSSGTAVLQGSVKMADGKTPATGAMLYFFEAANWQPSAAGIVDPAGNIQSHACWRSARIGLPGEPRGNLPDGTHSNPPGGRKNPVVLALLPGTCGATFVEPTPGKPLEIRLPAPQTLQGRVTIGGVAPVGKTGKIRVLAAYRSKDRIDDLLSIETTAGADGRFALSGLTAGNYEVQAALDDIWLSETCVIAVGAGPLADVTLDIGAPGGGATIVLTDARGTPLPAETITLHRPAGPLTKQCWPGEWQSDGAGRISIPTLEAGKHRFHVKADGSTHEIAVPPLSGKGDQEVKIEIRLAERNRKL